MTGGAKRQGQPAAAPTLLRTAHPPANLWRPD
jgi:hypothetical protein